MGFVLLVQCDCVGLGLTSWGFAEAFRDDLSWTGGEWGFVSAQKGARDGVMRRREG